jgi:MFS family permease
VAVAFVALLKFSSHWFAPHRFALTSGFALFVGVVGAVSAGVPLQLATEAFGWRAVMVATGALTAFVSLLIWLRLRDDPVERGFLSHASTGSEPAIEAGRTAQPGLLEGLRAVLGYRNTWVLALVPGGVVGAITTFAGLWGVPFLTSQYGMSPAFAAAVSSAMLISWALAGPVFGWLSDRSGHRRLPYLGGAVVVALGWGVISQIEGMPLWLLLAVLLITGFASGCMVVGFAFARETLPARYAGTGAGVINMGVMSGPMLLQPLIGWMLDRHWDGALVDGVRVYDFEAYRAGFGLMLGWAVFSAVLIAFAKENPRRA